MFVFLGIPYIRALIWECLSFWVYRVSVTNIGVYPKRQRLNYWYTNKNYTQKDKITYLVLGVYMIDCQGLQHRNCSTPCPILMQLIMTSANATYSNGQHHHHQMIAPTAPTPNSTNTHHHQTTEQRSPTINSTNNQQHQRDQQPKEHSLLSK